MNRYDIFAYQGDSWNQKLTNGSAEDILLALDTYIRNGTGVKIYYTRTKDSVSLMEIVKQFNTE